MLTGPEIDGSLFTSRKRIGVNYKMSLTGPEIDGSLFTSGVALAGSACQQLWPCLAADHPSDKATAPNGRRWKLVQTFYLFTEVYNARNKPSPN